MRTQWFFVGVNFGLGMHAGLSALANGSSALLACSVLNFGLAYFCSQRHDWFEQGAG